MGSYPNGIFPWVWENDDSDLNAENLNKGEDEIRAIERALGEGLVVWTGSGPDVKLSARVRTTSLNEGGHLVLAENGGNVRVGTPAPGVKLEVNGVIKATVTNGENIGMYGAGPYYGVRIAMPDSYHSSPTHIGGQTRLSFSGFQDFWGTIARGNVDIITIGRNQCVGIGTSGPLPSALLEVAGSVKLGVNENSPLGFYGKTPYWPRPTITGNKTTETAAVLGNLLTALANVGLITNSTT